MKKIRKKTTQRNKKSKETQTHA